ARALLAELVAGFRARGAEHVTLNVDTSNEEAAAVWHRLGFVEFARSLSVELAALEPRLRESEAGPTFGSVHVQTDDDGAVERAVRQFVPGLGRSSGTVMTPPRNGWIAVYDELCDSDPKLLRRLARELSDRLGAVVVALGLEEGRVVRYVLFDRGRITD